jgi:hypothetical protein
VLSVLRTLKMRATTRYYSWKNKIQVRASGIAKYLRPWTPLPTTLIWRKSVFGKKMRHAKSDHFLITFDHFLVTFDKIFATSFCQTLYTAKHVLWTVRSRSNDQKVIKK